MGDWTPKQADVFGRALSDLLDSRGVKRPALAETLDVSPELVRQWMTGASEPPRTKVFALEQHFKLRPGALSRLLGYLPVDARSIRYAHFIRASDDQAAAVMEGLLPSLELGPGAQKPRHPADGAEGGGD